MKSYLRPFLIVAAFGMALQACVPARQFEEMKNKQETCADERAQLSQEKKDLETERNELLVSTESMRKTVEYLEGDTTRLGISLRKMNRQYDKINELNDELLRKQAELRDGSAAENRKLALELQKTQFELQQKEDELNDLDKELKARSANLDRLNSELISREARVKELEALVSRKDSATQALKDKVAAALYSFRDKGLTVEQRNGKIYVSLEAKLLFPKGSTNIDPEGKKAILDLCKAIAEQKDISILVEGHTDSDPMKGGTMKDNWDLSVLRATAVVRLMVENGEIDPTKLTAAGRGEYIPVDQGETEDAKAKNRRIEIILTPDLIDLFEILED
ncbi:MAG: OmpA family protein [Salibacteraceae bacterium]